MAQIDILTRLFEDAEREFNSSIQAIIVRAYEEGYGRGLFEGRKIGIADYHQRLIEHVTAPAANSRMRESFTVGDTLEAEVIKGPLHMSEAQITAGLAKLTTERTPYGSVEKLVFRVLNNATPNGLTGKQITQQIHALGYPTVKEPSVRGTLRKLLNQGKVARGPGKLWTALKAESRTK